MDKLKTIFVVHQFEILVALIVSVAIIGYKQFAKPKTGRK
jgi:hypothetical protein